MPRRTDTNRNGDADTRGTDAAVATHALKHTQTRVLQLRFREGQRSLTHHEVGEILGLSARAVRRIERAALRLLRLGAPGPPPLTNEPNDWDEA